MTIKIDGIAVHASLTKERIIEACERRNTSLDNPGFCIACGQDAEGSTSFCKDGT